MSHERRTCSSRYPGRKTQNSFDLPPSYKKTWGRILQRFFPYLRYWGLLFPWALTFDPEGVRAHKSCQKWHHLSEYAQKLHVLFQKLWPVEVLLMLLQFTKAYNFWKKGTEHVISVEALVPNMVSKKFMVHTWGWCCSLLPSMETPKLKDLWSPCVT